MKLRNHLTKLAILICVILNNGHAYNFVIDPTIDSDIENESYGQESLMNLKSIVSSESSYYDFSNEESQEPIVSKLKVNDQPSEEDGGPSLSIGARYLGHMAKVVAQVALGDRISIEAGVGRYFARSNTTDKRGYVEGLSHFSGAIVAYMGSEGVHTSGFQARASIHYNKHDGQGIQDLTYDDKVILQVGQKEVGYEASVGYAYYYHSFYTGIDLSYFSLSSFKNFIPLAFNLGVKF